MYEVSATMVISASHHLRGYQGKCENVHGHNYKIEATVAAKDLDGTGLAVDFKVLKEHLQKVAGKFDHTDLNQHEEFKQVNPSSENLARIVFKRMLTAVLDRMPDYRCDPEGTVHYDTIGVIQGMKHLPATFTPGPRLGPGLDATLKQLQRICDEQELARPITERKHCAVIDY